ncbi:Flp family type IVb pilin [Sphingomicrobium astaxanthinifaciens]|uniref:Flp family type IVb pilin n=1 Tax=Sphingomicrobium astaxanthinifaciens TaxID=1227949 RepID=UPI001FCB64B6|nr:Flp family type IVb pilin [Sphingomicrobium astaxanthinifaciens]MCJ7421279.1 Flp family type IVb pilin [Sphingomicrobium astaxanthinifaciens]
MKMIKDEAGGSAAEYALILAIIGATVAIASILLGNAIGNAMNDTSNCLEAAPADRSTTCL